MFPSWHHHEIFRSDCQWQKWCWCKSSRSEVKSQVTEVKTQISGFGTITPVWFHILWWNDAQSLILFRSSALVIFKVICKIWRSHGYKNRQSRPKLGVAGLYLWFEFIDGYEMMHKDSLRYRPYEVTIPLGWASEGDRAPQFRQRILLFLRCHLTVPHGSGQSRVMEVE